MHLTLATCRWIAEEELLIAEYTSRGEFPDTGEPYQNSYVGYWFFERERVRKHSGVLQPAGTARLGDRLSDASAADRRRVARGEGWWR